MNTVDVYGHLADLKENDYKNTLAIATIIEVLLEKGIINKEDLLKKAFQLDSL